MNKIIEIMKQHRSIRSYLDKDISDEVIDNLIEVAQSAPTSINGQHPTVIVVKDREKKEEVAELAGGQPWISQAPVFLLFVGDFYKAKLAADKVDKELVITDSVEASLVAAVDIGLAMQNVITAAESLGLGIVPIGGIRRSPEEIIELFNLPEYTYPMVGLVIGHPADRSKQKPRMPKDAFRHDEEYNKDKLPVLIDQYDETMSTYLKEIGREEEKNWTSYLMNFYQQVYFPKVYPTMKKQGFKNER
ncbi:NADPH-dependent oxidoreductase [Orenia marismortui]|uniref:FMN reductase [NAD(P)H] n=1 Tax=Orenia marismortui TaxID=46469 RepID=A0A4R8GIJ9_9FIRM|nr:NADPH-dependent oxidoreductase [Orenia marismortui]TDX45516.1 FMN reductase [NAD(P)H] [Orenia marismortui]